MILLSTLGGFNCMYISPPFFLIVWSIFDFYHPCYQEKYISIYCPISQLWELGSIQLINLIFVYKIYETKIIELSYKRTESNQIRFYNRIEFSSFHYLNFYVN